MRPRWRGSRVGRATPAAWRAAGLLVVLGFLALNHARLLRGVAALLVIDEPLEPASAIVVLAGGFPLRESEAAEVYRAGLAPRILLVPERQNHEPTLRARGQPTASDLRREFLVRQGVPPDAIVVLPGQAGVTVTELQIAARAVDPDGPPVILVTSKYHARRVELTWAYVAEGRPRGIVRSARGDPFAPDGWWQDPSSVRAVLHEYAGLVDLGTRSLFASIP